MTQVAQLMQNGMQTFVDANGVPLDGGLVYMYVPTTDTLKTTWIDEDQAVENTNPIELDSAGRCVIYGNGKYRQYLTDGDGNLIWDKLTNWVLVPDESVVSYYDLPVFMEGKPSAAETYPIFNAPRSLKLLAGLTGSVFSIATLPTVQMDFSLFKGGLQIGTVSFATNGVPTVAFVSDVTFGAGDQFVMTAPTLQDATGASPAFTFTFTVV